MLEILAFIILFMLILLWIIWQKLDHLKEELDFVKRKQEFWEKNERTKHILSVDIANKNKENKDKHND